MINDVVLKGWFSCQLLLLSTFDG